jgi:hypothetical protein
MTTLMAGAVREAAHTDRGLEPEDFRRYVARRHLALLRTAYLLTGDHASAEDLVQTALARTWLAWGRIEDPGRRRLRPAHACEHAPVRLAAAAGEGGRPLLALQSAPRSAGRPRRNAVPPPETGAGTRSALTRYARPACRQHARAGRDLSSTAPPADRAAQAGSSGGERSGRTHCPLRADPCRRT